MGAWGYSALDNDPAYDVQYRWEERIVKSSYTTEEATEQFIKDWGDSIKYGDSITNMEIIALLAIHLNNNLKLPTSLKTISIDAINRELLDEALIEWESPDKRKEILLSLLHSIGGKVRAPKMPKIFRDPALCYSSTNAAKKDLYALTKAIKKSKPGYYNIKNEPAFIQTLRRLFNSQIWEKDYNIYEQAHRERLMMLSWYLGTELKMSEIEIKEMLEKSAQWPSP